MDSRIDLVLKENGEFTAIDHPDNPAARPGRGWVNEGRGDWSVLDGKLTITMRQVWVGLGVGFWEPHQQVLIDGEGIAAVTADEIQFANKDLNPLRRRRQ